MTDRALRGKLIQMYEHKYGRDDDDTKEIHARMSITIK